MVNPSTLQEDIQIGGTSLSTLGWNVASLTGQEAFPAKVGDNIIIPYRTGRLWKPKTYDQRVLTYTLWILGKRTDGTMPAVDHVTILSTRQAMRAQFNTNLDVLKVLLSRTDQQVQLFKQRLYPSGTQLFYATGEVASGSAAVGGGTAGQEFSLQPNTPWYGTVTLDIAMADPWWYQASPVTVSFGFNSGSLTNPGTAIADGGPYYSPNGLAPMTITFTGPLTNPRLRNLVANPVTSVSYIGTIAGGSTVQLNCSAMTALLNGSTSVVGNIKHAGSLRWMLFVPGINNLQLDNGTAGSSPGSGTVTIQFYPPYV